MPAKIQAQRSHGLWVLATGLAVAAGLYAATASQPAAGAEVAVYKSPWCGCCEQWIGHMRSQGHKVAVQDMEDLDAIKKMAGVPEDLQSCHTAFVDGYVLEGHVPAADLARLLAERPEARGLAVPGMPGGSPGMEGAEAEPFTVMLFAGNGGGAQIFAWH